MKRFTLGEILSGALLVYLGIAAVTSGIDSIGGFLTTIDPNTLIIGGLGVLSLITVIILAKWQASRRAFIALILVALGITIVVLSREQPWLVGAVILTVAMLGGWIVWQLAKHGYHSKRVIMERNPDGSERLIGDFTGFRQQIPHSTSSDSFFLTDSEEEEVARLDRGRRR